MCKFECSSWAGNLGKAIECAMSSSVAAAYSQPELRLEQYAFLVANADRNISQLMRAAGYGVGFRSEPDEAVRPICERPEVATVFGNKGDTGKFALQVLRSGHTDGDQRDFILAIVARHVCPTVPSGVPETVRRSENVRKRSAGEDLPGWAATIMSGLSLEGRMDIVTGLCASI